MKLHQSFDEIREQANLIRSEKRWSELACLFYKLKDTQLPIDMLLLKSAAIQLADNSHGLTLDDARWALEAACKMDSHGIQAEIEIGHFLFAVDDDAEASLIHFEAALLRSESSYVEALCGMAKAINELHGFNQAIELLKKSRAAHTTVVQQLITELRSNGDCCENGASSI